MPDPDPRDLARRLLDIEDKKSTPVHPSVLWIRSQATDSQLTLLLNERDELIKKNSELNKKVSELMSKVDDLENEVFDLKHQA